MILMADARLRITYFVATVSPLDMTLGEMLDDCKLIKDIQRPGCLPKPRATTGSQHKLPYTFVGNDVFPTRRWLRVPSKDNKDLEEIKRALTPAEIVADMLVSRFGILRLEHPSYISNNHYTSCAVMLHNYFLRSNPAYADLNGLLKDHKAGPAVQVSRGPEPKPTAKPALNDTPATVPKASPKPVHKTTSPLAQKTPSPTLKKESKKNEKKAVPKEESEEDERMKCMKNVKVFHHVDPAKGKVDPEPWKDIRDTPVDRELYSDDWMKTVSLDKKTYRGILAKVEPSLRRHASTMHPNKILMFTLRHLVTGKPMTAEDESVVLKGILAIIKSISHEYDPPQNPKTFLAVASEFEEIWNVRNCTGSINGRSLLSDHMEFGIHIGHGIEVDGQFNMILMTDARFRITFFSSTVVPLGQQFGDLLDSVKLGQEVQRPGYLPEPKAPMGSKEKMPFTFIGNDVFSERKWLRVPSKDNKDQQEIERALKPAEIVADMLVSRFGIFRFEYPSYSCDPLYTGVIILLHNYFLRFNPAYADPEKLVKQCRATQQAAPKQAEAKKSVTMKMDDNEWMNRLKIDHKVFLELLNTIKPKMKEIKCDVNDEDRLRMAMKYLVTGVIGASDPVSLVSNTFCDIGKSMTGYQPKV